MGGIIFSFGPDEELNTEHVVVCALVVIEKQDITVKEVTNMKVVYTNQVTGKENEIEAGPVGVFGMNHGERMDIISQLVRDLFKARKKGKDDGARHQEVY